MGLYSRGGGGLDQGVNSVRKGLDFADSITILSLESDLAIKRPHCKKTRGQIPLHSTDVHGPKSSWNGKCFLLLACVKSCSTMNVSDGSENFIVEPFHGQEFSTNGHSQTWNFPLVLYINGIFRWCSFH